MFIQNVAIETVGVWKSLGPSAFSHTDNPVLFGMKNSSLRKSKGKKKKKNPVMFDSATGNCKDTVTDWLIQSFFQLHKGGWEYNGIFGLQWPVYSLPLPPVKNGRPHYQVLRLRSRIDIHRATVDRISCVILTLCLWMISSSTYIPQRCWLIWTAHVKKVLKCIAYIFA